METLRTQVDILQWEVNLLDGENRKLMSENVDATKLVDLKLQGEQLKEEVAKLERSCLPWRRY